MHHLHTLPLNGGDGALKAVGGEQDTAVHLPRFAGRLLCSGRSAGARKHFHFQFSRPPWEPVVSFPSCKDHG